jgi:hypothetical protein
MPLIRSHIRKLARAVYQKSANSDNSQIRELGHYDPIGDKYLRPLQVKLPCKATLSNYHPLEQTLNGQKVCSQVSTIQVFTGSHNPGKVQSCGGHTDQLTTVYNPAKHRRTV